MYCAVSSNGLGGLGSKLRDSNQTLIPEKQGSKLGLDKDEMLDTNVSVCGGKNE